MNDFKDLNKSNRTKFKFRILKWFLPITGLLALIWFLIRVIPKPSRATYPCQRAAFPIASGFVIWITGIIASTFAFKTGKKYLKQSRTILAVISLTVALTAGVIALINSPENNIWAANRPANAPIGTAKGVNPGRVVWVHDPNATNWAGYDSADRWYNDLQTNRFLSEKMVSMAIRKLTGKSTDKAAWDALFRYTNQSRGKGNVGYQPGEKITIKLNFTISQSSRMEGYDLTPSLLNNIGNSPQLIRALLRQLVSTVGIAQSNITIGDSTARWPNHYYNYLHTEFPNVVYEDDGGTSGRTLVQPSSTRIYWSTVGAAGKTPDYLTQSYVNAEYFIDFAILKGHSSGITLSGKNHYGSLIRKPADDGYYNLHLSLPNSEPGWSPGMGHYRAIVDLLGHPSIGGKTVLYLIDGLYAGYEWDSVPHKWQVPPFNNDWPSSLFASQDGIAIDSVCFDFLRTEWPYIADNPDLQGGAEDYLHEGALADNPPSGTFYDPDLNGTRCQSLGVHEHWNNSSEKKYSRNLGTGNGIELVKVPSELDADLDFDGKTNLTDHACFATGWLTRPSDAFYSAALNLDDELDDVNEMDLAVLSDCWLMQIAAPSVANLTESHLVSASARLNGQLTSNGNENPCVRIYWGDNDGAADPCAWDHYQLLSTVKPGTFYANVAGLSPLTTYYYRCRAENSAGTAWSSSTRSFTTPNNAGAILREYWTGIAGTDVYNLTSDTANYPHNPAGANQPTSFEAQLNFADNYGTRMRGYVKPTTTGSYTFYIASNYDSELWLSTNNSPANRVKIAYVDGYTNQYEWTKYGPQASAAKSLTAGQMYYIEAIHKASTGTGDHLEVAWKLSSNPIQVIPSANLYAWTGSPIGIFEHAQDIGSPTQAGSTVIDTNGFYAIDASGADISGTSDQFHFANRASNGDVTIIVKIQSVENTNSTAKAGIMIRESLAANSKFVMIAQYPDKSLSFGYRSSTAGSTTWSGGYSDYTRTKWLKLVRLGNNFTAYSSTDGHSWGDSKTVTISMTAETRAGLAVTSRNNAQLCTGVFSAVSFSE